MSYLCRAERQVLAKAYASSLDLNLSAPSRGTQVCRTSKPRLCVSSIVGCQQKQHGFFDWVYRFSTTTKQPSTNSVNEEKKCLVESGKVTSASKRCLLWVVRIILSGCSDGTFDSKGWHFTPLNRHPRHPKKACLPFEEGGDRVGSFVDLFFQGFKELVENLVCVF